MCSMPKNIFFADFPYIYFLQIIRAKFLETPEHVPGMNGNQGAVLLRSKQFVNPHYRSEDDDSALGEEENYSEEAINSPVLIRKAFQNLDKARVDFRELLQNHREQQQQEQKQEQPTLGHRRSQSMPIRPTFLDLEKDDDVAPPAAQTPQLPSGAPQIPQIPSTGAQVPQIPSAAAQTAQTPSAAAQTPQTPLAASQMPALSTPVAVVVAPTPPKEYSIFYVPVDATQHLDSPTIAGTPNLPQYSGRRSLVWVPAPVPLASTHRPAGFSEDFFDSIPEESSGVLPQQEKTNEDTHKHTSL